MLLYDFPRYYEVAFSFRDIAGEARFLHECVHRYSDIKVDRVFEIGCGHGPHAAELTALGYTYAGLDNNQKMLGYARDKWRHLNPQPEFFLGDMANFRRDAQVDFAFVMLGSLYLSSSEEIAGHFDSMARVLRPGGLYFLDWCVQFSDPLEQTESSFAIEREGIRVLSSFDIKALDEERGMYEEVWTVNVDDHGQHRRFEMNECNKAIFPEEFMEFLNSRADFEFVGWWQDWDFDRPIEPGVNPVRPVALLKRV